MADIDHFKQVNDAYGHEIGDRLLREVARAIAQECRDVDLPARYGGEEFAIVVPDERAENAAILARRCRQRIEEIRLRANDAAVRTTVSFGVADASDLESPAALIRRADEALYEAKAAGRNTVLCSAAEAAGTRS